MKVLIFTVTAGHGHNAAATVLKSKFEERLKAEVKIIDVFKAYTSKLRCWFINDAYLISASRFVNTYNFVFKRMENAKFKNRYRAANNGNAHVIAYPMLKEIYDYKPDLIIATHFVAAGALSNLKMAYNIPAKIATLTLDYEISPYWECCTGVDYMFMTHPQMKEGFLKRGFKEEQLFDGGIPLRDVFYKEPNKDKAREELGLDPNIFTLAIYKAAFFAVPNAAIIKELCKVKQKIQVVIINGRNEKTKNSLDKLIARAQAAGCPHTFQNYGYTTKVGEIFAASDLILKKAGGATVTEVVTMASPSLIISKLPMQEIHNKQYLIDNGCALSVDKKNTISKQINYALQNPDELIKMKDNCRKVRKLFVADKYIEALKDEKAGESAPFELETKNQVIKKVKKALKSAHKTLNKSV